MVCSPPIHALSQWLPTILDIAMQAGEEILAIYEKAEGDYNITSKEDNSPLTAADLASHQKITQELAKLTPEIPCLSEESSSLPYSERATWEQYWLIDPLDGTKEFIKRNGEFTVNIALIHQGVSVLGVVYAPVLKLFYYAVQGSGAYKQYANGEAKRIQIRPLQKEHITIIGSRSHRGDSLNAFIGNIGNHNMISMGSSLKFCLVAEGEADIYPRLGLTSEWDTAAAQCVVEEAGGHIITLDGSRLCYNTKESLLNPYFLVFGDNSHPWLEYLNGKE